MATDPFDRTFDAEPGRAIEIMPGCRRVLAPNPSPMTFRGTNTYILGESEIAIIDPGPDSDAHLYALRTAIGDLRKVSHILVTHSHLDHSPLSRRLAAMCSAPILALGDSQAGLSPRMAALAAQFDLGGGEGTDTAFRPDLTLADGAVVSAREWQIEAIATPGHFSNHLCFAWDAGRAVFSGDHVMSWATTLVSPPDGDLTAFMASLDKMGARLSDDRYFPGHGGVLEDPAGMIAYQREHRRGRESQILAALDDEAGTPLDLARRIYTEVDPALIPAAARNVFAHLIDLVERNQVSPRGDLSPTALFEIL
jgi:glyoxylase-like metal-dependent hydrolase (beta-lactamase superfamily II)